MSDMQDIVAYATKEGFEQDIQMLIQQKASKIDIILAIIDNLEQKIKNKTLRERLQANIEYAQGKKRNFNRSIKSKSGIESNEIYVKLTQVYYLVRTLITGETIDFIETIEGKLKVIHQQDWLDKLSGGTKGKISLYSTQLKESAVSLQEASDLSIFTRANEKLIDSIIEWGSFNWNEAHMQVGEYKGHPLYQKMLKDMDVYAYYSHGRTKTKTLLYQKSIYYNLGQLQETILANFEEYASIADQNQQLYMIHAIQNSEHPVSYFINSRWTPDTTPGTVQGDFRTITGQWLQSKRDNTQVITTFTAHNAIVNLKLALLELKQSLSLNSTNLSDDLIMRFTNMFNAEVGPINESIKNKIGHTLTLMGQSVI